MMRDVMFTKSNRVNHLILSGSKVHPPVTKLAYSIKKLKLTYVNEQGSTLPTMTHKLMVFST